MKKTKLIQVLSCFLIILSNQSVAQMSMDEFAEAFFKDSSRAIFFRAEVSELSGKPVREMGFDAGMNFWYAGDIPEGIAQLTNTSVARIKMKGTIPNKYIGFWGERFNTFIPKGRRFIEPKHIESITNENLSAVLYKTTHQENQNDPANIMIINALKKAYGFSMTDIEDTTEVWVVKIIDSTRLTTYESHAPIHSDGGCGGYPNYSLKNFPIKCYWEALEKFSRHIVYSETDENKKYTIPEFDQKAFYTFDTMNQALEPIGLRLFKEKRLEKLKLIQFYD